MTTILAEANIFRQLSAATQALRRQLSANSIAVSDDKCCICFEPPRFVIALPDSGLDPPGITCPLTIRGGNHFVCRDCFSQLVKTTCEESAKLHDCRGEIKCPVPSCRSTYEVSAIRRALSGHDVDVYMRALIQLVQRLQKSEPPISSTTLLQNASSSTPSASSAVHVNEIAGALSIRCPNRACAVVLDPSPDGCCAMRCAACGQYFCWLCLQCQPNSSDCHSHVRNCHQNPEPSNLFPSQALVANVHKLRRLEAIRRYLIQHVASAGINEARQHFATDLACQAALEAASPILRDSHITVEEVLSSSVTAPDQMPIEQQPATLARANNPNVVAGAEDQSWLVFAIIVVFGLEFFYGWFSFTKFAGGWWPLSVVPFWLLLAISFTVIALVSALNAAILGALMVLLPCWTTIEFSAKLLLLQLPWPIETLWSHHSWLRFAVLLAIGHNLWQRGFNRGQTWAIFACFHWGCLVICNFIVEA